MFLKDLSESFKVIFKINLLLFDRNKRKAGNSTIQVDYSSLTSAKYRWVNQLRFHYENPINVNRSLDRNGKKM